MQARTRSIGCAPPTPFAPCQSRSVKSAGEVFRWRRSIVPFPYGPLRSELPGSWRLAASASETPVDVDVPDVTTAIEQSIQRAVERASAMEPKPAPAPPPPPPPPPSPPEPVPTFKETVPAQTSPSTVSAVEKAAEAPAPAPVPEPTAPAPVPVPEPAAPAPVPVPEPAAPAPPETIVMKTPEVPKPIEFSQIAPPESVAPRVDVPASPPPELPPTPPASSKVPSGVSTEDVKAAASQAITGAKNAASQAVTGVQDAAGQTVSGVKKAAGQALTGVQDAAKRAAGQAAAGVQNAADQAASGVQKAAGQAVTGIQESADRAASGAKQAASRSVDSVVGAASDKAGQVKSAGTDAGKQLQGVLTSTTDSVASSYKNLLKGVANSVDVGKQAVQSNLITPVKSTAASAVDQVTGIVPPGVKDAVGATVRPVVNHPVASLLTVTALAGVYAVVTIRNRFLYRPPSVTPFEALGLLEASEEPALLVDLRPEEERADMGIPRLRKRAFGKGTGVEAYRLPAKLATRVRNQTQAEAAITAAYISGQQKASILTKIILMGSQSEDYKSIVDALRASGFSQVAVMDGGFASWVSAGLPVNDSPAATYETGTLDAITEYAQVFADGLTLKSPYDYAKLSAGAVVLSLALYNYAFVLQMVGVIGPLVSGTVILINDYDSPADFFKEMAQIAGKTEPEPEPKEKETSKSVNGDPGAAS